MYGFNATQSTPLPVVKGEYYKKQFQVEGLSKIKAKKVCMMVEKLALI